MPTKAIPSNKKPMVSLVVFIKNRLRIEGRKIGKKLERCCYIPADMQ
jgi:hypothetical protein